MLISLSSSCILHPPPSSTLFPYTTLFRSDRDEGDAGLVLVALAHLVDADLLGEPPGAVRVVLVAIERDGLLLDVVGGGDAHVLPSLTLEVVAPGSGHAVDPAGVDHQHGGGPVGLGGRFLGVLLLGA